MSILGGAGFALRDLMNSPEIGMLTKNIFFVL
jgi:hypothetical protein